MSESISVTTGFVLFSFLPLLFVFFQRRVVGDTAGFRDRKWVELAVQFQKGLWLTVFGEPHVLFQLRAFTA